MRMIINKLLLISMLTLAGQALAVQVSPGELPAHGALGADDSTSLVVRQGGMTLSQAVDQVKRQYPNGRIVSANTQVSGGRETHVIKVLTEDGKVKTVRVPGRSRN